MNKVHISNSAHKQLVAGIALSVVFAIAYLYFLNLSVVHVVMRKEADQTHNQLQADIAQLETRYIAAQHEIAGRIATLEGYQKEIKKTFISRADTDTLVRAN